MEDWEQERAPRKNQSSEKTSRLLDLPADGVAGVPKVELLGDRELYLENYKGILSYGKEELHVDGGAWVLRISGRDLEIKAMREQELRIFAGSASWRFCEEGERGRP
ncbi:MAG: YabP/YqfC family sporulation protein [Evtepia gabavorous]